VLSGRMSVVDAQSGFGPTRLFPEHLPSSRLLRRWKLLALVLIVLVLAGTAAWWIALRPTPVNYVTAPVTRGAITRTVGATGTVNPVLTIIVGSYVSGVISEMYCDYNTRVKKGQVCARIDARPYKAALDQAEGQLSRDTAQLQGAKLNLTRYAVLADQDSVARQVYDDQVALVQQLTGTVAIDRAAVETARVNLGYTNITSPVDGTVVARNITIGQTVAASFQTPTLFLIAADLTRMQVDTNVSESDIGVVKVGDAATFAVEAFPERSFPGKVTQVRQAPQTVQNVVTYDVVLTVENNEFLLKPGMTATVAIITARRDAAVRIPDQALRFTPMKLRQATLGSGAAPAKSLDHTGRVWVLRGKPTPVDLTVGLDDDTSSELIKGALEPGDQLIIGERRAAGPDRSAPVRFGF
jgi:HlyD family secretion protein